LSPKWCLKAGIWSGPLNLPGSSPRTLRSLYKPRWHPRAAERASREAAAQALLEWNRTVLGSRDATEAVGAF
jgi:hypothetical protein